MKQQQWGGHGWNQQTQGYLRSSEKPAASAVPKASEYTHGLPTVLFSGKPTLLAALWKLSLKSSPGQKGIEQIL